MQWFYRANSNPGQVQAWRNVPGTMTYYHTVCWCNTPEEAEVFAAQCEADNLTLNDAYVRVREKGYELPER